MHNKSIQTLASCAASTITASGFIPATYVTFGNIKITCATGEVEGLSENISEDAKFFWEQVKEYIIGK